MAGGQERILRGRIRSVQATKKITRAMELIAASRIVKAQLERGYRLVELLKQPLNSPMPVEEQVVAIFAGTRGHLDAVPVADVRRFEAELLEWMRSRHGSLLSGIRQNPKADLPKELGELVAQFAAAFVPTKTAAAGSDPTKTDAGELGDAASKKTLATE